jgi:hypothetical protein
VRIILKRADNISLFIIFHVSGDMDSVFRDPFLGMYSADRKTSALALISEGFKGRAKFESVLQV